MKGLDWSNESYVRLYRADTPAWRRLHWEAQGVYMLVLRQLDRAGTMPLDGLLPFEAVAVMTGAPDDVAERSLAKILTSGLLEVNKSEDLLVDPEFLEREETAMSDAMRKRESRATRRDRATLSQNVTPGSQNVTNRHDRSQVVTDGHGASRSVTPSLPCLALPCLALPSLPEGPGFPSGLAGTEADATSRPTTKPSINRPATEEDRGSASDEATSSDRPLPKAGRPLNAQAAKVKRLEDFYVGKEAKAPAPSLLAKWLKVLGGDVDHMLAFLDDMENRGKLGVVGYCGQVVTDWNPRHKRRSSQPHTIAPGSSAKERGIDY